MGKKAKAKATAQVERTNVVTARRVSCPACGTEMYDERLFYCNACIHWRHMGMPSESKKPTRYVVSWLLAGDMGHVYVVETDLQHIAAMAEYDRDAYGKPLKRPDMAILVWTDRQNNFTSVSFHASGAERYCHIENGVLQAFEV